MRQYLRIVVVSLSLCLLGTACGDMAAPVDSPADARVPNEGPEAQAPEAQASYTHAASVDGARLDNDDSKPSLKQGPDFDRATPVLMRVHQCDDCATLHISKITHDSSSGDDEGNSKDNQHHTNVGHVADGNPVPFPLDKKFPGFD